jgi:hypothetical protein
MRTPRTPTSSNQSQEHSFAFAARIARKRGWGTKLTHIYSCKKFGVRKDGREDFPGTIVAS